MNKSLITLRTQIPSNMHRQLRHLALDHGATVQEVVTDAVALLLRFHGRGQNVPGPVLAALGEAEQRMGSMNPRLNRLGASGSMGAEVTDPVATRSSLFLTALEGAP